MNYLGLTKRDIEMQKTLLNLYTAALDNLPEGKLIQKTIKNHIYFYSVDSRTKKQNYIKRENMDLVYQLKYRKMLEDACKTFTENIKVQSKVLKDYKLYDPSSLHSRLPAFYKEMPPSCYHKEFFRSPESWASENYRASQFKEGLTSQTTFGLWTRSKSEAFIAELIHAAKIPFRYEERLELYDKTGKLHVIYPDFSFLTPLGEKIYWEHLGLWPKASYRDRNIEKFSLYFDNNIVVPKNLIITMDDANGGLDVAAINRVVTGMLLPLFQ